MVNSKKVLGKVIKLIKGRASNSSSSVIKKLTADEVELMHFKRRAYLENVKKQLSVHRRQYNILANEDWDRKFGIKKVSILSNGDSGILKTQRSILGSQQNILGSGNILSRGNSILVGGSSLW